MRLTLNKSRIITKHYNPFFSFENVTNNYNSTPKNRSNFGGKLGQNAAQRL